MFNPTLNETLIGMGIICSLLSIGTFYMPEHDSRQALGDAIISLSKETGLSQSQIWLLIALFFFAWLLYSKFKPSKKTLPKK